MLQLVMFLGILAAPPELNGAAVITGKVHAVHTHNYYFMDEDDGSVRFTHAQEEYKGTENIQVFLIDDAYCGVYEPIHERVKRAEQKFITRRDGEYWFITKPGVKYRVYYVVGVDSYNWHTIEAREGTNRIPEEQVRISYDR